MSVPYGALTILLLTQGTSEPTIPVYAHLNTDGEIASTLIRTTDLWTTTLLPGTADPVSGFVVWTATLDLPPNSDPLGGPAIAPANTYWIVQIGTELYDIQITPAGGNLVNLLIVPLPAGSLTAVMRNPMTSPGDLIEGGAAGVPLRLPAGANNSVLTIVAGSPAWAAPQGGNAALVIGVLDISAGVGALDVVLADAITTPITITLPDAATRASPVRIKRINSNANTVTIATTASQTIDGQPSITSTIPYQSYTIVSDGANWWVV